MRNHMWTWWRRPASPGGPGPWAGCKTWLRFCLFIYLFLAALGLRCCTRVFSSCGEPGLLCCGVRASHCGGFSCCRAWALGARPSVRLSSCGAWAQVLHGMWDLPRPGLKPVSPALAGGFLTTAPPGKPLVGIVDCFFRRRLRVLCVWKEVNRFSLSRRETGEKIVLRAH